MTPAPHGRSTPGRDRGHPRFAAFVDWQSRMAERGPMGRHRRRVAGAAAGRVLEVGAGPGSNFAFYGPLEGLVALDPDPHMLRRARRNARRSGRRAALVRASAEALPFADASFDAVVATHVFCTVPDPDRGLAECARVLRPGGRFYFWEHVRADRPFWQAFQNWVTPLWRWVGAGCHPNRDTAAAIRRAGLVLEEMDAFPFGPFPVRPHILGVAVRPAREY